ncbi:MAG TPA: TM0106 family RecB-like putative nuclease [Patescibacteria group bacterium]|nr:TM0106 family RecB-like putative nuclease [Patescibacteria group bacterium]
MSSRRFYGSWGRWYTSGASAMPRLITQKSFYQYLRCPTWVYFDASQGKRVLHDSLLERLSDDGLIPEKEKEIISDRPDLAEVTFEDPEEAFRQTLAFMREGRETIYRGALVDGHWVGTPDVLAKVEGRSSFGPYYYVAADVKHTHEAKDDHRFQGCFYAELLKRIQGIKPLHGYVITPDRTVLGYAIEEFESTYRLTLDAIERIVAGEKPNHFLTSGCKQSPWFSECRLESESCDDLSVVNRVWREEVDLLRKAGFKTFHALAALPFAKLKRKVGGAISPVRLGIIWHQAQALREGTHRLLAPVPFPQAKTELYFDIESDPLRDTEFLFGVLEVREGKEKAEYRAFLARKPEEEGVAWKEFVAFIEKHPDAPIYHYGWFEVETVRRLSSKYGTSAAVRDLFNRNMIDLLSLLRPCVAFPFPFYSLKDIASYVGFSWRAGGEAVGTNAVLWFEQWLASKGKKRSILQKIVDYNEDDVRATWAVKQWAAVQYKQEEREEIAEKKGRINQVRLKKL